MQGGSETSEDFSVDWGFIERHASHPRQPECWPITDNAVRLLKIECMDLVPLKFPHCFKEAYFLSTLETEWWSFECFADSVGVPMSIFIS